MHEIQDNISVYCRILENLEIVWFRQCLMDGFLSILTQVTSYSEKLRNETLSFLTVSKNSFFT